MVGSSQADIVLERWPRVVEPDPQVVRREGPLGLAWALET